MTFYYGELLFKLGSNGDNQKYCDAAPVYTKVVELESEADGEVPQGGGLRGRHLVEELPLRRGRSSDMRGHEEEAPGHDGKEGQGQAEGATRRTEKVLEPQPIPEPEEDDRGLRHVHQVRAGLARAAEHQVPQGAHLLRGQPLRRGDAAVQGHRRSTTRTRSSAIYSANLLFDCLGFNKKYDDLAGGARRVTARCTSEKDADFKAQCATLEVAARPSAHRGRREGRALQGRGRALHEARHRLSERPEDRRGLLQRRRRLREGQADRLGDPGARQLIEGASRTRRWRRRRSTRSAATSRTSPPTSRRPSTTRSSPRSIRARRKRRSRSTSASFFRRGLGENDKSIKDVGCSSRTTAAATSSSTRRPASTSIEGQIYEQQKDNGKLHEALPGLPQDVGRQGRRRSPGRRAREARRDRCGSSRARSDGGVNGACIELKRERAGGAARVEARRRSRRRRARSARQGRRPAARSAVRRPSRRSSSTTASRRRLKEAMAHFAEALKLFKGGAADKKVPGKDETERAARTASMNYYAAEARMSRATSSTRSS